MDIFLVPEHHVSSTHSRPRYTLDVCICVALYIAKKIACGYTPRSGGTVPPYVCGLLSTGSFQPLNNGEHIKRIHHVSAISYINHTITIYLRRYTYIADQLFITVTLSPTAFSYSSYSIFFSSYSYITCTEMLFRMISYDITTNRHVRFLSISFNAHWTRVGRALFIWYMISGHSNCTGKFVRWVIFRMNCFACRWMATERTNYNVTFRVWYISFIYLSRMKKINQQDRVARTKALCSTYDDNFISIFSRHVPIHHYFH